MILLLNTPNLPAEISNSKYLIRETNEVVKHFDNIDRLNIFVGANNAGKSRFMRGLIKKPSFIIFKDIETYNQIQELIELLDRTIHVKEINKQAFTFHVYNERTEAKHFINDAHKRFFEKKFTDVITLNNNFFSRFKTDLQSLLSKEDNETNFEELISFLKHQRDILDIATTIHTKFKHYGKHPHYVFDNGYTLASDYNSRVEYIINELDSLLVILDNLIDSGILFIEPTQKIYIPVLRSARTLFSNDDVSETNTINQKRISKLFEDTIINSYGFNSIKKNKIIIATGLDLYESIKRARNERKEKRRRFEQFEQFIQETFFNNRDFEIIAREVGIHNEEHINVSIDNEERDIHDLGDGIQSIIILLYPIFMAEPKSWIFIEEPELHLHPGLQRIFIESLLLNKYIQEKQLIIFFTTHSNHLLDFSLSLKQGISIFTFQKNHSGEESTYSIQTVKSRDISILNLLEVNNASVFLANCSIWIEGVTDRIYLRSYLKAFLNSDPYKEFLHEDLHFAFFEYAGSNISHYLFEEKNEIETNGLTDSVLEDIQAQFLSNRILLIADADAGKSKKHTLLTKQQSPNFKYICLPVREIENLLSPPILKQSLPFLSDKFEKSLVDTQDFNILEYRDKYLGEYLKNKFGPNNIPKKLLAESGTLATYYKNKLAEIASSIITWDNMSNDAKELTETIYEYILSHNPQLLK